MRRLATGEWPFVVCPRGAHAPGDSTRSDLRYTHRGGAPLLAYIDASLAALEARYPGYVDPSRPLLAGFSLGASEILALAAQDPARFPRIALVEGGTSGCSRTGSTHASSTRPSTTRSIRRSRTPSTPSSRGG